MDLISNQPRDLLDIAAIVALADYTAPKVHLFKNDIVPDYHTVLADLVEADYTGYSAQTVTWQPAAVADSGDVEVIGVVPVFTPTGSTITNVIYGLWLDITAGGTLLKVARFDDAPLPMGSALDQIIVTLRFRMTEGGIVVTVS